MNTFSGVNSVAFNKKFNSPYSALGLGTNDYISAVALLGDNLYVGGAFTTAGGISANRVAVWNITTSTWSSLGSGVNGIVLTIYADPTGNIYVGGSFTSAGGVANTNGIARWNSVISTWFAMGTGVSASGIVWSISALSTTDIYVVGNFTSAGGVANTPNAARFINGTTWTAMGTGCNGIVYFVTVLTLTNVYVCGEFTSAGGVANTSRVAMWNGTAWTAMGTGLVGDGLGICALSPTEVYVTGRNTSAGGVSVNAIARWNGLAWNAMGTGIAGTVTQGRWVHSSGGYVYVAGWFDSAGGVANTKGIARWNISSSQWSNVGRGITDGAGFGYAIIARTSGSGFVGGTFTNIGGVSCSRIARFDTPEITIQKWNPLGAQALNSNVYAIHWTSANSIYVGGEMTQISGVTVNYIARWDGITWSTLGSGVNGNVRAIYAYDSSNLLVGGQFTSASGVANTQYIARWNTVDASWSSVASVGANNIVWTIHGFNSSNLFVGGQFTQISGVSANGIARWSAVDASWSTLTTGISGAGAAVYAIHALSASNVYVGGDFTTVGGVARANIARWDGSAWNSMSTGANAIVRSISAVDSSNVYVGGQFTLAGGVTNTAYIARWNGNAWTAMGTGANNSVWAVSAPDRNNIFIAGLFTSVSGITGINRVARWDATNSTWNALGTGMNNETYEIDAFNANNVYVGGAFTTANSASAPYIAKWEGDLTIPTGPLQTVYSELGSGVNALVRAVAVLGDKVYVGGNFSQAGGVSATRIAVYDMTTSTWSALGTGVDDFVTIIFAYDTSNIYVGGIFSSAGGVANTRGIARWNSNNSTWNAMGTGVPSGWQVWAISGLSNSEIYAGGWFPSIGGVANTAYVARWNGSAWNAMASGFNGTVYGLYALSSTNVYAIGQFTSAVGVSNTSYIAMWNGSAWTAMGTGLNAEAYRIFALSPTEVYAGGFFTTAGGVSANYIARWNGITWNALGTGLTTIGAWVHSSGGYIYAVGSFTSAGGVANTRGIARWNISSSQWLPVGTGITDGIGVGTTIVTSTSGTGYIGGSFTNIGGLSCIRIARFDTPEITIQKWNPLGSQVLNNHVYAIHWTSANSVYVGGALTQISGLTVNYIARWDGVAWSTLGAGVNGNVRAIYAYDSSNLLVGGQFTSAGGVANTQYIAKWNTVDASWSSVASGGANNVVWAIHGFNSSNIFVGGLFTQISGVSANGIARWSAVDASWSALTTGISGAGATVYAIYALDTSNVYVGGDFTTAGGSARANIARWNGSAWNSMSTGTNSIVRSISAVNSTNVYVGGQFTLAGGVTNTAYIAKWDGSAWIAMGTGANNSVWAVSAPDWNNIFIAGLFTAVSGITGINRVARWDATNSTWNALGTGMNSETYEIDAFNANNVYAGGAFTTANNVSAPYIAKWEGDLTIPTGPPPLYSPPASWRRLNYGNQTGPGVQTLSIYRVDDFNVYVASGWDVWRYNGYIWTQIGTGNSTVWCIHSFNDGQTLYAIGTFTTMSGVNCNYVARYDGTSWSAFGSGLAGTGRSVIVAVDSANIFIGGQTFGSNQNIRKYNSANNTWTALNTIGEIYCMQYVSPFLYSAGSDGQVRTYNINSGAWANVGSNRGNRIYGMYVLNTNAVYISGWVNPQRWDGGNWIQMSTGGGEGIAAFDANNVFRGTSGAAGGILKWNGTSWATFAGGAGALVYAIVPTGANSVYIGGDFGTSGGVGGSASFGVAYYT